MQGQWGLHEGPPENTRKNIIQYMLINKLGEHTTIFKKLPGCNSALQLEALYLSFRFKSRKPCLIRNVTLKHFTSEISVHIIKPKLKREKLSILGDLSPIPQDDFTMHKRYFMS